ncbi:uncharacterized protein LOC102083008 [Oreochromis niloticus]|uniref:uncharacterized protein LOC102083008 n=1 Tax=Oreochromis niloticus TaxID=8128 RepID=UPI0003943F69|nr:uncharacterized protein LOC102083008 [Oreochromis niloticus]
MLLSLQLLLVMVCWTQASDFFSTQGGYFYGTFTSFPKNTFVNGSALMTHRAMVNTRVCYNGSTLFCFNSNCDYSNFSVGTVDEESTGEWCQMETILIIPGITYKNDDILVIAYTVGNWVEGIKNTISSWGTVVLLDQRNRSDIGKENSSPQSTIIPVVRVPSNCQRKLDLLMFDPDGDEVKCRYGKPLQLPPECNPCNPPSVLNLSTSCSLSFSPTDSSNEGAYAVQVLMEDFPRENITMTGINGTETKITPNDILSRVPVQFVLLVDPAVPSCTEGDFLPKFLPPTPANRAQLYTPVNKALEISISAEAQSSTISELLFSGPYNTIQSKTGPAQFTLRWTPSERQDGESQPFCFVVQALSKETKYHSDLRCVSVTVRNGAPASASAFVLVVGSFISALILPFPSI